jgi:pseudaminic acid biosynthesis-associated methylase
MRYKTDQEAIWAGEFGSDYIKRNESAALLAANLSLFSHALRRADAIQTCVEFGANVGMNLRALKLLYPEMVQKAVEINQDAASALTELLGASNVYCGSIFDYKIETTADLALVKGVLIHVNPEMLQVTYEKLYAASIRWILICEYYSPSPMTISYRGHSNQLFKRDFAGEMLSTYANLRLVDYGFVYRRDPAFPQDDINWFLLEKRVRDA